jgi:hypothetical protein
MNEPVRIVGDWLNGTTSGSTSVATIIALSDFPKDAADSLPSNPTHYDSTTHGFAARGEFPKDDSVTYPCVVVGFGGLRYEIAEEQKHTADALLQRGNATVHITVAHRLQDSDEGVEDVGYLVRAVKGSLTHFHRADVSKRTRNGFQLIACESITMANVRSETDDKWIGTQMTLTYSTHETTPD